MYSEVSVCDVLDVVYIKFECDNGMFLFVYVLCWVYVDWVLYEVIVVGGWIVTLIFVADFDEFVRKELLEG